MENKLIMKQVILLALLLISHAYSAAVEQASAPPQGFDQSNFIHLDVPKKSALGNEIGNLVRSNKEIVSIPIDGNWSFEIKEPQEKNVLFVAGGHGNIYSLYEYGNGDWIKEHIVDPLARQGLRFRHIVLEACDTASLIEPFKGLLADDGIIIASGISTYDASILTLLTKHLDVLAYPSKIRNFLEIKTENRSHRLHMLDHIDRAPNPSSLLISIAYNNPSGFYDFLIQSALIAPHKLKNILIKANIMPKIYESMVDIVLENIDRFRSTILLALGLKPDNFNTVLHYALKKDDLFLELLNNKKKAEAIFGPIVKDTPLATALHTARSLILNKKTLNELKKEPQINKDAIDRIKEAVKEANHIISSLNLNAIKHNFTGVTLFFDNVLKNDWVKKSSELREALHAMLIAGKPQLFEEKTPEKNLTTSLKEAVAQIVSEDPVRFNAIFGTPTTDPELFKNHLFKELLITGMRIKIRNFGAGLQSESFIDGKYDTYIKMPELLKNIFGTSHLDCFRKMISNGGITRSKLTPIDQKRIRQYFSSQHAVSPVVVYKKETDTTYYDNKYDTEGQYIALSTTDTVQSEFNEIKEGKGAERGGKFIGLPRTISLLNFYNVFPNLILSTEDLISK